jgi:energy-coupling factor transporter ATP-binding protein EcfA2
MHKEANGYRQSPRALCTSEISKRFGGAAAFDRISLSCIFDCVRAVLGESGAGKSALVKRMSGVLTPTRAASRYLVGAHHFIHPAGLALAEYQLRFRSSCEFPSYRCSRTRASSLRFGGLSPIQQKRERGIARHLLDRSDALVIRGDGFVRDLTLIQRQQVEITKALTTGAKPENADRPTHANTDWGDLGMKPIRFGIISTARIATKAVMPAMQASRLCDIVAISSRDGDRAAAIAKDFGIARSYGSHQALLDDPNVDAVYIATPNDSHVDVALRAAAAGKHVLCEKPIALNGAEAATLLEARDRYKVEITEALMVRYQPRWLAARELVRQGRFGRIEVIHANFTVQIDDPEDIRLKPELGGGALYDVGVYPITAARFLFEAEPV